MTTPAAPGPELLDALAAQLQPYRDIDARVLEVRTAMLGLAMAARLRYSAAKYVVLADSDQGSWAVLDDVLDEHGDTVDFFVSDDVDEQDWTSHLYDSHRHLAGPYVDGDEDHIDGRNPWRGVWLDIDKLLADPPAPQPPEQLGRPRDAVGRTVAQVREQDYWARLINDRTEVVCWTETVLAFTDGTELAFASSSHDIDAETTTPAELMEFDEGRAIFPGEDR